MKEYTQLIDRLNAELLKDPKSGFDQGIKRCLDEIILVSYLTENRNRLKKLIFE